MVHSRAPVEFSVESRFGGVPAMCALFRWGAGRPWLRRPAREGRVGTGHRASDQTDLEVYPSLCHRASKQSFIRELIQEQLPPRLIEVHELAESSIPASSHLSVCAKQAGACTHRPRSKSFVAASLTHNAASFGVCGFGTSKSRFRRSRVVVFENLQRLGRLGLIWRQQPSYK
jgi:hypothetical protein